MFRVKVHKRIEQITEVFYRVGFWQRQDAETVAARRLKLFYSIYYCFVPISIIAGTLECNNKDEMVFSVEASIMTALVLLKLLYLIWRKREILERLNQICEFGVEDRETFTQINDKLNILMKLITIFFSLCFFCEMSIALVIPFLGTERKLFPLDCKNNKFAYCTAFVFIFTQAIITMISMLFSVIVWYLLANCGLRYVALGHQIKVMGEIRAADDVAIKIKISNTQTDKLYQRDLLEAITSQQQLEELTNQMCSFLSNVFAAQLATSAFCICASVYCLAFNRGDNLIENIVFLNILLYNLFDIFMIMYLGNELELASDRLSYCLFESNWVDRSQSIKKNIFIFGEFLMKSHQLIVLNLNSLNLETFRRIVNSAYSMFNILQNFK